MRFVFAEVLRVRRRGMKLQSEGSTHNNYYIVPTVKSKFLKINIFLESGDILCYVFQDIYHVYYLFWVADIPALL